jgi:GxxExxY protein
LDWPTEATDPHCNDLRRIVEKRCGFLLDDGKPLPRNTLKGLKMTPNGEGARGRMLLHQDITSVILKGFYQVHYEMGFGFGERPYVKAMEIMLRELGLSVQREAPIQVHFHGQSVGDFKADLIVESAVLIEVKSMRRHNPEFEAQVLNYLRATDVEVGLLLYFNPKPLKRRLIYTNDRKLLR